MDHRYGFAERFRCCGIRGAGTGFDFPYFRQVRQENEKG